MHAVQYNVKNGFISGDLPRVASGVCDVTGQSKKLI